MNTKSNLRAGRRVIILAGTILALLIPNIAAIGDELTYSQPTNQPVVSTQAETPLQSVNMVPITQEPPVQPEGAISEQAASASPSVVNEAVPEAKPITVALPSPKQKKKAEVKAKPAAASHKKVARKSPAKPAARKSYAKKQAKPVIVVQAPPIVPIVPVVLQETDNGSIFSQIIEKAKSLVSNAFTWLGTRYVWGGTSRKGIDCSGLTQELYAKLGIKLPHSARLQAKMGQKVAGNALKPGDLVFFNTKRGPNTHVGVYIGDGKFLHAANPKRGVRIDSLQSAYYGKRLAGARRYS